MLNCRPGPSAGDVPLERVRSLNQAPVQERGEFVLYWMQAFRRLHANFALQRAAAWAAELHRPLVILESLPCRHRWASRRHHQFVLDAMADHRQSLARRSTLYYPYVESQPGQLEQLLDALGRSACLVVGDDYPIRQIADDAFRFARRSPVLFEVVDSNGLLPMRAADRVFSTAHAFRRFLQKNLPEHLLELPRKDPLSGRRLPRLEALPKEISRRWPAARTDVLDGTSTTLDRLPIDQRVAAVATRGGPRAAHACLRHFLDHRLARYLHERNDPDADVSSGLSPYLHFGNISAYEIFHELACKEQWSPDRLAERPTGSREGWWGMSPAAESFLDELVTWRELAFNLCSNQPDYDAYATLPDWAQTTLRQHARDRRPVLYNAEELQQATTHDPLWNAAQRQLQREGRLHNYLRMLWGKKILEWSRTPQQALQAMIELNNKYGLDGDDPNSYSGISWVLGRYDRPWGPQRAIFGTIRYMSSENTARKLHVAGYLARYADPGLSAAACDT